MPTQEEKYYFPGIDVFRRVKKEGLWGTGNKKEAPV